VQEFRAKHGKAWDPAPLLVQLAAEGKTFGSLDEKAR
jgi:hypothetical protein